MDEKPDEIMSHIEEQREQLGRNLNELESRVKSAADWRVQFDKQPMLLMGVALGGGILLGSIVGNSRRTSRGGSWSTSSRNYAAAGGSMAAWDSGKESGGVSPAKSSYLPASSPAFQEQKRVANETLDHIKAALIGFATAKVKEFMSEALPGFNQHLDEAQRRRGQGSSQYTSSSDYSGSSQHGAYDEDRPRGTSSAGSSYGNQANTRTDQPVNSTYAKPGAGQNPGMNI